MPVAASATVTTLKNEPIEIQLSGTDDKTTSNDLLAMVVTLPSPTLGKLYHLDGSVVQAGDLIPKVAASTVLFVPVNYTCCKLATFTFVVLDDVSQQSTPATITIDVLDQNTAPFIDFPATVTVERNYAYGIPLTVRDYDVADTETFVIVSHDAGLGGSFANSNGVVFTKQTFNLTTVQVGSNGEATVFVFYTAPKQYSGANYARFSVLVRDAAGAESVTGVITINIKTSNVAPITTPVDPIRVLEKEASAVFNLYGEDSDNGDANSLTVVITSLPVKGTLVQVGAGDIIGPVPVIIPSSKPLQFYYQASHVNSDDSLTFFVVDNLGASGQNETVSFYVIPVNDAPEASLAPITTNEDTEVVGEITTFDLDGDQVYIVITSLPIGKLYQLDGTEIDSVPTELLVNSFKYLPPKDAFGTPFTSFTFHATDKNAENFQSPTYTAVINVEPVNDAPISVAGSVELNENDIAEFSLVMSDVDSEVLTAIIVTLPSASLGYLKDLSGKLIEVGQHISEPHTIQFHPNSYSYGMSSFDFFAFDGVLNSTAPATVDITVIHVNHAPTVTATSPITTDQATPVEISFNILEHDNGDVVSISFVDVQAGEDGSFSFANVPPTLTSDSSIISYKLVYTPPLSKFGENYATFSVNVTDQDDAWSFVTVVVNVVERDNVAPVTTDIPVTATQDFHTAPFSLSGTDQDAVDANALVFVIKTLPILGLLSANGEVINSAPFNITSSNNNLTYITFARGADAFTFYAVDTVGAQSAESAVVITILSTNHNPTIALSSSSVTTDEDVAVTIYLFSAEDPDEGDILSVWVEELPLDGALSQVFPLLTELIDFY